MPRGDGTGPAGMGPMTGRGAGYCAGYNMPGHANPLLGRGCGRAGGHGWRHWFYATGLPGWARSGYPSWGGPPAPTPEQESGFLKAQAENLRAALERIEQRLQELAANAK